MKDSGSRLLSALSPKEKALLLVRVREKKLVSGAVADRIVPRDRAAGPAPLSFAQQRLWFLDRLMPGDPAYNIPWPVWFDGPLDADVLRSALAAVVARHEALRTTFQVAGADPVQVVAPVDQVGLRGDAFALPRVDLSALGERAEGEAARLQREEASLPFDLGRGPLLRTVLVRLAPVRHLLLLTLHHIVSDAWSTSVLVREVAALYRGEELRPLPIQYADFAVWQRRRLSGELLESRLSHWRERLAGMTPVLGLPTDRPRPPVRSTAGDRIPLELPAETAERLRALARASEATPFMVLLAAFLALLQRLTGQDDLCVGAPVANRDRTETAGLIGFFVNTLVLRGDLSGDPSFGEMVDRVRKVALDAFAHQDLPFERLVEELRPERDPSRSPLIQVSFSLQTAMEEGLPGFGPVRLRAGLPEGRTVRFDLTLSLEPGFAGALLYSTALFDGPTARRMAGHFVRLATAACAGPGRRLSDLPLLTEAESAQLLREWNDTWTDGAPPPLHDSIAAWVERAPDAVAVDAGDRFWTYGELWARATSLAGHLRGLGVFPEAVVGLQADRSPELVLGILAVWMAGGAYLPLDPGHPAERRAWVLEDVRATVLLAEPGADLPPFAGTIVPLGGDFSAEAAPPRIETDPDTLAYVIYTSGSTGRPKGVMVAHRGLSNLAAGLGVFAAGPGSRVLLFASPGFDASLLDLALALGSGGTLCVAPGRELPELGRLLRERRITHLHLPPSALSALGDEGPPPGLECVILGGEPCPEPLAARWGEGRRLFNDYGPTESTVFVTIDEWRDERREGRLTTGRPISGVEAHLLDFQLRPVPIGVHGEICLVGAGLARGYLGLADWTAERFVPSPFGGPGERLYRTGDLARRLPDGRLDFLGRIDHQVKVRGFRVEPGEIEAALVRHPAVREAVVVARGEGTGRALAAYVVPGEPVSPDELRSFLRARLPGHMVPASIGMLGLFDRLPLTPNGKVDRRALGQRPPGNREEPAPPRSGLEQTLAGIWAGLLGLERVGRDESFFDLGGHSLLLARLQAELREKLNREVPLLALFEHPTVGALAAWLDGSTHSPEPDAGPDMEAHRGREKRRREALEQQRGRQAGRRAS
jgi:amino acid adenylation domain-containing protein